MPKYPGYTCLIKPPLLKSHRRGFFCLCYVIPIEIDIQAFSSYQHTHLLAFICAEWMLSNHYPWLCWCAVDRRRKRRGGGNKGERGARNKGARGVHSSTVDIWNCFTHHIHSIQWVHIQHKPDCVTLYLHDYLQVHKGPWKFNSRMCRHILGLNIIELQLCIAYLNLAETAFYPLIASK